jgi:phosphomannomutase/phosphoglucomutase
LKRPLKVVAACGNGTAGEFAPEMLKRLGCEVIALHCEPDYTFPHHNPNPEDMGMLHDVRDAVLKHCADVGLAFDGDGDRCGVVDNMGEEIFADKVGLMIARDQAKLYPNSTFVVDVKSTGLFATDPVLSEFGCKVDYWMTGHSHMKRRVNELVALTGFEKSGHYFFNSPIGKGYDCGLVSAIAICEMLDRAGEKMSVLKTQIGTTWITPTMAPFCPDETKYGIVDQVVEQIQKMADDGVEILGQKIVDVNKVNGIRFTIEDGTWGLVRASSNKPSLVVVCESAISDARMREMFEAVDGILQSFPDVGEYDQKL